MRRRLGWLSLLAALVLVLGAPPAHAASRSYVALGDSYGSGVGTYLYYPDGSDCYRSPFSYPSQVAARYGLTLTLEACSGATTADVLSSQVPYLPATAEYVSLTVGGNDLGFASVINTCALPGWLGHCDAAIDAGLTTLRTALPDRLSAVYAAIRARAPGATVTVTGYPLLFNGTDCNPLTFFSVSEMSRINAATVELNGLTRARAEAAGLVFVAAMPTFAGHAWCDRAPWINGLTLPTVNSYHPNFAGHAAYARLVGPALVGAPATSAQTTSKQTTVPTNRLRLPSVRSAGGPFRLRVPDLQSRALSRAAARAGLTRAELAQLRRAQRSGASNATLDRLDATITARAAARR